MKWYYLLIDLCCIAGPLALSFDKKIAFFKQYKAVFLSILFASSIYLVWDVLFTKLGIWQFNSTYILGKKYIGLPIEEYIFFAVVPYACLFVYACLKGYFPKLENVLWLRRIAYILLFSVCFILLIYAHNKLYTAITAFLLLITLLYYLWAIKSTFIGIAFLSAIVCSIPMAVVNGLLTSLPILMYNNSQNLCIRIHTLPINNNRYGIPVEDFLYNALYMLLMIMIYEKFTNKREVKSVLNKEKE